MGGAESQIAESYIKNRDENQIPSIAYREVAVDIGDDSIFITILDLAICNSIIDYYTQLLQFPPKLHSFLFYKLVIVNRPTSYHLSFPDSSEVEKFMFDDSAFSIENSSRGIYG